MQKAADAEVVDNLKNKLKALNDVYAKVQTLRQIPFTLLKEPSAPSVNVVGDLAPPPPSVRAEFTRVKEIVDEIKSDGVQEALRAARESEARDRTGLRTLSRRENLKRKRPPIPASPQPYIAPKRRALSLFPPSDKHTAQLRVDGLVAYVREFNQTHRSTGVTLRVWKSTKTADKTLDDPAILRFDVVNVLSAYVVVGYVSKDDVLHVESVMAFGPREKKAPHSPSNYTVYKMISQQLATMIKSCPGVSLQAVMDLLLSFRSVFVDRCTGCKRVMSFEGHVPPVLRVWTEDPGKEDKGKWEPKHVPCRYATAPEGQA